MKKIFSITNLRVKRVALILTLITTIGVCESWAEVETSVSVTASPQGAGTAGVAKTVDGEYKSKESQSSGKWYNLTGTHTYYLKASTTSSDWLWKGWMSGNNIVLPSQTGSIKVEDDNSLNDVSKNYTATWVQPKVDNVTNPTTIVTNPIEPATTTVTFTLTDDLAAQNYEETSFSGNNMY